MSDDPEREYILGTARELFGRIVYSHKTHEKEREFCSKTTVRMNVTNVALSGLTTFLAVISAVLPSKCALIATAISAMFTVGFAVWQASFDPASKESQQRIAAKELLWIREQLMLLIMECHMPSVAIAQLQKCLETINRELTAVYKFAPNTSPEAYAAADKAIKSGQVSFSDEEIDALLPPILRRRKA